MKDKISEHSASSASRSIDEWVQHIRDGNVRAVARAITLIENQDVGCEELLSKLFPYTGHSYLIGVTGAPGSGKSTLVDRLTTFYREKGEAVGIIAVDPTSPYTGGAVLGDRIRMQRHSSDEGVFIRSMATRGFLGGLTDTTGDVALVLDASGKDKVIIETVGVGQGEIEIVRLADCTIVVLVPGLGDDVQNMKAGVMEIADIFVLNKADREGVERLEQQLDAMLQLGTYDNGWKPPVVRAIATQNEGIAEIAEAIQKWRDHIQQTAKDSDRRIAHWKRRLLTIAERSFRERVIPGAEGERLLEALAVDVTQRKRDPYSVVRELLARAGL